MNLVEENEKLRVLLQEACNDLEDWKMSFMDANHQQTDELLTRIYAALSLQSEPVGPAPIVDALSFVQPVPDHCDRIVWRERYYHLPLVEKAEPAPAQDEREAFEAHMRLGGYSNPEKHPDGSYVSSAMELWWQGWNAYAAWQRTRPAQTAPQPEQSEALAWKVLEAATDALDRRAAPHAWLSQTWEAGSKIITSRRAAMSTPPSPATDAKESGHE